MSFEETDERLLDNPVWNSLVSNHCSFAIGSGSVRRYPADMFPGAGFADPAAPDWAELAKLMTVGERVGVPNQPVPEALGFISRFVLSAAQYIYRAKTVTHPETLDVCELNEADVPDMLRLVELTQPGPFRRRAIEMGRYVGIRVDGNLVAMAGERMHPGRFREVSAVCTHPAFAKRGYATQLVTYLIARMLDRGDIPFLHVVSENEKAIRLYQALGFDLRGYGASQLVEYVGAGNSTDC